MKLNRMKARYILGWICLFLLGTINVLAQTENRLYIPDVSGMKGSTVVLPICMDNAAEVTALQFTLKMPEGVTLDASSLALTEARKADHLVTVRNPQAENVYTFMAYSPTNQNVKGNSGEVMTIKLHIPETFQEESVHQMELSDVVLSRTDGTNVMTNFQSGNLKVLGTPDLQVEGIAADKQQVNPGEKLVVSWTVNNIGSMPTTAGWSERITLVAADGSYSVLLGTVNYDNTLNAGGVLSRQVEVTLPELVGIGGAAKIQVEVKPYSDAGEPGNVSGNNKVLTDAVLTIDKVLYLEIPQVPVEENTSSLVRCKLSRSGSWQNAEQFTLAKGADARVDVPTTVSISSGQSGAYFYLSMVDNDVLDNDSVVTLSVSGNGYDEVVGRLIVEDNEFPTLTVESSQTEINEGETFQLVVTTERVASVPTTIYLACDHPKRFTYPAQVTMPAGEKQVTVNVVATEDDQPDVTVSAAFTASAAKHNSGEDLVLLYDNDLPEIELVLTPSTISESAGPTAVMATLKRLSHTDNKITVKLSDDSNNRLYYSTKSITFEAGMTEAEFTMGVIDNTLVDGEQEYSVTAAVYISSCSCSPSGTEMGVVSRSLTVLDDDGPALKIETSKSMMLEGAEEATVLTVTRNTDTSEPLTVAITSDYDEGLVYERTVTIPAGVASVKVPVAVKANETSSDDRTVVFSVVATGYTKGTCWVMVTDQTLPDMTVKSVNIAPTEILAGDEYNINITFANIGVKEIPARSTYTVSINDEILTLTIAEPIPSMEEKVVSLNFIAPSVPGNYDIGIECNKGRDFDEILEFNNTFSIPFVVNPAYTYTVETDRTNYQMGDVIKITGKVTALKGGNSGIDVEPYIVCYGSRQALLATTDINGNFKAEYTLPSGMGGDFTVGVCAPGEGLKDGSATIHVYGMARTTASYIKSYLTVGTPYVVNVPIKNLSSLPLHNIKATVTDNGGHYQVTAKDITLLEGNSEAVVELTLLSEEPSTTNTWECVGINLSSEEGATMNFVLYNFANTQQAKLVVDKEIIRTNITNKKPTNIPVVLTNTGLGETGRITVTVPENQNFFSLTTPTEIPSLSTGDSAVVGLCFNPEGLDVNVVQKGNIAINCEKADGQIISYSLKVVGEEHGNLLVRVQDENTIYGTADGQYPYVEGAHVVLKDYNTGKTLYADTTTVEGAVLFEQIPEGYYTLYVSASKHSSYMQHVLVSPGETTEHLATISYQAISISWNVEETTVEDKYEIVSEFVYETQVPVPVVELITPDTLDLYDVELGGQLLYHVTVVNRGLITANNVCVELPVREGFLFTPLDEYAGFDLAPQEGRSIPVLVTLDTQSVSVVSTFARAKASKGKCHSETYAGWEWVCKGDRTAWIGKIVKFLMRTCDPDEPENSPKDPTPGNAEPTRPEYPDGPEPKEPQLRYVKRPVSQVDLMAINKVISTVACSMACLIPDLPKLRPPYNRALKIILKLLDIPEPNSKLGCIIQELQNHGNRFSRSSTFGRSPELRDYYLDRLQLLIEYESIIDSYYEELTDAPKMLDDEETVNLLIPNLDTILNGITQMHNDGTLYSTDINSIYATYIQYMPQQMPDWYDFNLRSFIERQINTFRIYDKMDVLDTNYCDTNLLEKYRSEINRYEQNIKDLGYVDCLDMIQHMNEDAEAINGNSENVCASVKLQFKQEMVFTRQAFRGTLVIENSTSEKLTDISPFINATNEDGILATGHEMQINLESVEGFVETSDGVYSLDGNQTGTFTFLFIPTKFAAPNNDVTYKFGGSLTFNDGNGLKQHTLYPVALLVKPTPELDLTYFMQRDIFGDDPLTEIVEPMSPAEFTLLINNKGYGDATDVRMTTHQPEIIDNEKGLLIDFELLSSQLNGGEHTLALDSSVVTEFGTIPAQSTAYAQWWLQSTLLGHFTEYDIEATHVSSYGNEDLSLLDEVTIHELIHSLKVPGADGTTLAGFLVNDIADAEDMPDMLYLSDATIESVNVTTVANITMKSDTEYLLDVTPTVAGWNYGSIIDPTNGKQNLIGIIRQSDGQEINVRSFWQTDRTLRDGRDPLYENRLHFADKMGTAAEQYLLTFEPKPELELAVESFTGVPDESTVLYKVLETVTVRFNKPIDASTFTTEDLTLNCQGKAMDVSKVVITALGEQEFELNVSELTKDNNGYYVLTVQTAGIEDNEGFKGATGKQATWIQFADGKVTLKVSASPVDGGTVTPKTGLQDYGTTVALEASPAEGYEFLNWKYGSEVLATVPSCEFRMEGDAEVVATFVRKHYDVTLTYDETAGTVSGGGTGIYDHGTVLTLTAEPLDGYAFAGWNVNGEMADALRTWSDTIRQALVIEALFVEIEEVTVDYDFQKGWNWFSVNVADKNLTTPAVFLAPLGSTANKLMGQNGELTNDPVAGWTGTLETIYPNQGYRLQVNDDITFSIKGEPLGIDGNTITLENGWNWISYRPQTEMSVGEALKNLVATAHDVVKGKASFAMFDGTSWVGSLTTMSPGAGYLMQSHGVKSFNYPASENGTQMYRRMSMSVDVETDGVPESWQYDVHQYEGNTAIVARLYEKDAPAESGMYLVAAFVDGECRGVSVEKNGYLFLTVHGDVENEVISFIAYDPQTGAYSEINETVLSNKEVVGTFETPQRLSIRATQVGAVDGNVCMTCTDKEIRFYGDMSLVTRLDITDMSGKVQLILDGVPANGVVDASGLAAGVYVVTAHTYSGLLQQKFIRR